MCLASDRVRPRLTMNDRAYTTADWCHVTRNHGVAAVAESFGLSIARRTLRPCPSCNAEQRGSTDKRGPVGVTSDGLGWRCHRCDAHGDAVTLAAWIVCGDPQPTATGWRTVREHLATAGFCDPEAGSRAARTPRPLRPRPAPPTPTPPARPPLDEVAALWDACIPVCNDAEAVAWLRARHLDPCRCEDLARVLPEGVHLPEWARYRGAPWIDTHRLVIPMHDERGQVVSLHARSLRLDCDGKHKAASPTGYEVRGLVMAEPGGGSMLACTWQAAEVWIVEGAPDFLTLSTYYSDANEDAPAVLGIVAGSWQPELAARIPDHVRVVIATHEDDAGNKYAERIAETLRGRVELLRWRYRDEPQRCRKEVAA